MKFDNFIDTAVLGMDTTNDVLLHLLMMSDADIKLVTGIRLDQDLLNKSDDAIVFKSDKRLLVLHNDGLVSVVTAIKAGERGSDNDDDFPPTQSSIAAVKAVGDITFRIGLNDFADFPNLQKAATRLVDLIDDDNDIDVFFEVDNFDDIEITK